jgi:5-(carboxyamino)imidazole ribonucleotide synthase
MSKRIGILGGGQLGLLLAQSLIRLGAEVHVFDPDAQAPACQMLAHSASFAWSNEEELSKFFEGCDCLTYEFENVESELLFRLEKRKPLYPAANVLRVTQNRLSEKRFLSNLRLPHVHFAHLKYQDLVSNRQRIQEFGLPCLAKTAFGGYDGKGQYFLQTTADAENFANQPNLQGVDFILEEAIQIAAEVSCIVAHSKQGQDIAFPVLENIHHEQILDLTIVPSAVPLTVQAELIKLAHEAARRLKVVGLLTVEFFLSRQKPRTANVAEVDGWYIMINEFAPRPHNSGHVTMKACDISQYDALARILMDVPLTKPLLVNDDIYFMGNLLGEVWLGQQRNDLDLSPLKHFPSIKDVVIYGKKEARSKRKMGHFVGQAVNHEQAVADAREFREALSVPPKITHPSNT